MTLLPNTITWGVPSTASINHADMICSHCIQRLPPLQSNVQDGKGREDGVAKAYFVRLFSFPNAKSYSIWEYCSIRKCFVFFKLAKQMRDSMNPISVNNHLSHIYTYAHELRHKVKIRTHIA